jgi:hypothetical protein
MEEAATIITAAEVQEEAATIITAAEVQEEAATIKREIIIKITVPMLVESLVLVLR